MFSGSLSLSFWDTSSWVKSFRIVKVLNRHRFQSASFASDMLLARAWPYSKKRKTTKVLIDRLQKASKIIGQKKNSDYQSRSHTWPIPGRVCSLDLKRTLQILDPSLECFHAPEQTDTLHLKSVFLVLRSRFDSLDLNLAECICFAWLDNFLFRLI
jgi:hypothetical protein